MVRGIPFRPGPIVEKADAELAVIALWHTADGVAKRGKVVGEMIVNYANEASVTVPLRWEDAVTSPTDLVRRRTMPPP